MLKILFLSLFLSISGHSYISDGGPTLMDSESLISITQELFNQHSSCMKSMVNAPHSPSFTKNYFQTISNSEYLTLRCENLNSINSAKFVFISEKDVLLLDLPKFISKDLTANGTVQIKQYPSEVIHFLHEGQDFYLDLEGHDMNLLRRSSDLEQISSNLKMSKTKLLYDVIGKFEAYLKSRNLIHRLKLREANDDERGLVINCLITKQESLLSIYFQSEGYANLPGVEQMQKFLTAKNLVQVPRERYSRTWEEWTDQIQMNFYRTNPRCLNLIKQDDLARTLNANLSLHKKLYVQLRHKLEKEEALILGRAED